jgi:hypothetical protein
VKEMAWSMESQTVKGEETALISGEAWEWASGCSESICKPKIPQAAE